MSTPWDARTHDVSSTPQQAWAEEVPSRLDGIPPDATILDVGCRTGRATEPLLALVPAGRVLAIDASLDMVEIVRARTERTCGPGRARARGCRAGRCDRFDRRAALGDLSALVGRRFAAGLWIARWISCSGAFRVRSPGAHPAPAHMPERWLATTAGRFLDPCNDTGAGSLAYALVCGTNRHLWASASTAGTGSKVIIVCPD